MFHESIFNDLKVFVFIYKEKKDGLNRPPSEWKEMRLFQEPYWISRNSIVPFGKKGPNTVEVVSFDIAITLN